MMESAEELARAVVQRVRDLVELAAAEIRLAALSSLTMLLCVMIAAAALVVAWGLLVACILYVFSRSPVGWPIPALGFAVGNAAFAYYLWQVTVRLSRNLTLPELRMTLRGRPEPTEAGNNSEAVALVAGRS
jgi:hypothetical protein